MEEPKTPYFYDFWIWGRVPGFQNQLCLSLETPGYLTKSKNESQIIFDEQYGYIYIYVSLLGI